MCCAAEAATQQSKLDETVAANPEEIDLDDIDEAEDGGVEAVQEVVREAAEAAKQEIGHDSSVFQPVDLHNYDSAAADLAAAPTSTAARPDDATASAQGTDLSPALKAALDASGTVPQMTRDLHGNPLQRHASSNQSG